MGRDKAQLLVEGRPMAARVASALADAGAAEVVAVGGDRDALEAMGLRVVDDDEPGGGPLPATLTALRRASHDVVAVLSCDLLHPSAEAVTALVSALIAGGPSVLGAVPLADGHHQWTHAVWRQEALVPLHAAQASGARSLRRATVGLPLATVADLDPRALEDADTPTDLGRGGTVGAPSTGSLRPMDVPEIDVTELAARRAAGAPLIDVREVAEFADAHVPGAHLIPLGEVAQRIDEVSRDETVYVICARGARSARAVEHYRSQGIDAVNVAGGTRAWMDAGHPTDQVGRGAGGE
jgi:rhodanese-related sulfurtransferase/molybdopterin-guanine dinucleotide biosynthesis protein A